MARTSHARADSDADQYPGAWSAEPNTSADEHAAADQYASTADLDADEYADQPAYGHADRGLAR